MREIKLEDEVRVLRAYVNWYNSNPAVTREELYKSYYGDYQYLMYLENGNLDKFLTR